MQRTPSLFSKSAQIRRTKCFSWSDKLLDARNFFSKKMKPPEGEKRKDPKLKRRWFFLFFLPKLRKWAPCLYFSPKIPPKANFKTFFPPFRKALEFFSLIFRSFKYRQNFPILFFFFFYKRNKPTKIKRENPREKKWEAPHKNHFVPPFSISLLLSLKPAEIFRLILYLPSSPSPLWFLGELMVIPL